MSSSATAIPKVSSRKPTSERTPRLSMTPPSIRLAALSMVPASPAAGNASLYTIANLVKSFIRSFAGDEWLISFINIGSKQVSGFSVGTCNDKCGYIHHVSS